MRVRVVAAAALAVVSLSACGQISGTGSRVSVRDYDRPNGGTIECANNSEGGIDCDWENAT